MTSSYSYTRVAAIDMLTWAEGNSQSLNPPQRTGNKGMLRVGEIVFPGNSTAVGYPVPNGLTRKHVHATSIRQTGQVVLCI